MSDMIKQFEESLEYHLLYFRAACRQLEDAKIGKVPDKQVLRHDISKKSDEELPHYALQFFGGDSPRNPDAFAKAWIHHIHNNPHHWQHWIFPDGYTPDGSGIVNGIIEMPRDYAIEMIADWIGSSRAYTGSYDMTDWLVKNAPKILLHPNTAHFVTECLVKLGYKDAIDSVYSPFGMTRVKVE